MTFEFSYSWINGVKFWKTETRITGLFYMLGNMFYSRRNFLDLLEGEKRKRKTPPMMVILPVCQWCRITNGRKIFTRKNKNIKLKRRKAPTLGNGQMMQRKFRILPPTNSLYIGSNCHSFLHVQPSCLPKPLPSSPSHRSLAGVNRGSLKH